MESLFSEEIITPQTLNMFIQVNKKKVEAVGTAILVLHIDLILGEPFPSRYFPNCMIPTN